jgi:RNA polymerase sigma-70 factor (sigma-E family)
VRVRAGSGSASRPPRRHIYVAADTGEPASVTGPDPGQAGPPGDLVAALYRAHALSLLRAALLLVGDRATAEDVVQDAFCGLYRGWRRLRDPDKALAYLRAAVTNGCRSVLRSRSRAQGRSRVAHDPPVWSAETAVIAGEDRREALAAVARLPHRQREVLVLRYYLGLSNQDIAAALRVSRGTVSSSLSRALAALAHDLREEQ